MNIPVNRRVIDIIRRNTDGTIRIEPSTILADICIDSLSFIRIIIEIENEFGFEFNDSKILISSYTFVEDILSYVRGNLDLTD